MKIGITIFRRREYARGNRRMVSWDELACFVSHPVIARHKGDAGGFSLATFRDDRRWLENVETVSLIGFDFDSSPQSPSSLAERVVRFRSLVYSTHSHAPDSPRSRVILAVSRPMSECEHARVGRYMIERFAKKGLEVDRAARDASRLWYAPAIRRGAPFEFYSNPGPNVVDVDHLLRRAIENEPAPQRCVVHAPRTSPHGDPFQRARAYVEKMPSAVSGNGGHRATFAVARTLRGFVDSAGLSEADAWEIFVQFNQRCLPKWRERELVRKFREALTRVRNVPNFATRRAG